MAQALLSQDADAGNAQVTVENLPAIIYMGQPVITTDHLARLYGVPTGSVRKNFSANQDRFTAGKHYFKLEGDNLKAFSDCIRNTDAVATDRDCVTESNAVIPPRTRNLLLWTARGAARHAKMLNTDTAWEVFETLEDTYFASSPPEEETSCPTAPASDTAPSPTGRQAKGNVAGVYLDDIDNRLEAMQPYFQASDDLLEYMQADFKQRGGAFNGFLCKLGSNIQEQHHALYKELKKVCALLKTMPAATCRAIDPAISEIARQNALKGWEKRRKKTDRKKK